MAEQARANEARDSQMLTHEYKPSYQNTDAVLSKAFAGNIAESGQVP